MGLEPTTLRLGRRPVYGLSTPDSTRLRRVASLPLDSRRRDPDQNRVGAPAVDPDGDDSFPAWRRWRTRLAPLGLSYHTTAAARLLLLLRSSR